jgi:hypothetical protein
MSSMSQITDSDAFLPGSGPQKALEASGSTLIMDVGQVERNIRTHNICNLSAKFELPILLMCRLLVPPPVHTNSANVSPSPSSSVTG